MGRILAAIAASLVLAGCGSTTEQAASSTPSSTTTTTTTTVAVADWAKQAAPVFDKLGNAMLWIGGAMQSMDFRDARAGGRELDSNISELEALMPSPNPAATAEFEKAIENLRLLARGTQGLSPATTSAELDEMAMHRDQANEQLNTAVGIITGKS